YRIPLYATGDSVELVAGYSSVDSGTVQGLFDVSGNGRLFGARYIHKPARAGDYAQQISAGFDWRDFTSNVGFNGQPLGNRVLTHPLSVAYGGSWRRNAIESGFTATLAHNLPGGRYGREEHFRKARAEAPAAFTVLRVNAHAGVELPRNWQLRMDFQAQYSADPLVSGEQFGLGGADSIRGLRERALAGDKGYKLSADLLTPALPATQDLRLRGLVFYDCGRLGRNAAQPGEPERQGVASAGLGLRLDYSSYLRLRLDWAHILKGSGDTSDAVARAGDERIHASLLVNF
ncbi:MAG: BamA/TamA family outer membrane protein, partial [Rhodocyclaceae bacterium]|nr:BamA/TamA family outer membrane protein [Rhodocyclaceae bacterium]